MGRMITLTPEKARYVLTTNYKQNRKPRASVVNKIASDITNGRWDPDVSRYQDPLLFTTDGVLLNGQHRCLATIQSGQPIEIYAEYDVPETVYKMIDGITPRNAADFIDVPNKKAAAALARIMCAVEDGHAPLASAIQGKIGNNTNATRTQIIEKITSDKERIHRLVVAGRRMGVYLFGKSNFASVALFLVDFTGRDDVVERFVYDSSQLSTESQQINALRAYMGKCTSNKNFKADCKWGVSCILSAYEAFRTNSEIHQFNKLSTVFSKYDKFVFDTRKERAKDALRGLHR